MVLTVRHKFYRSLFDYFYRRKYPNVRSTPPSVIKLLCEVTKVVQKIKVSTNLHLYGSVSTGSI